MANVRSLEAAGLGIDTTPSGMKEELLLVSWLIVLLRTREDGQASFEWAYKGHEISPVNCCQSTEVMADLRSSVGQTAAAIARKHSITPEPAPSRSLALLLSTSALSQTTEEPNEVSRDRNSYRHTNYTRARLMRQMHRASSTSKRATMPTISKFSPFGTPKLFSPIPLLATSTASSTLCNWSS